MLFNLLELFFCVFLFLCVAFPNFYTEEEKDTGNVAGRAPALGTHRWV